MNNRICKSAASIMLSGALVFSGAVGVFGAEAFAPSDVGLVQVAHAKAKKVWIAPKSGKCYHYSKSCRGLRNARSVKKVTLKKVKRLGMKKPCGWCAR